MNLAVRDFSSGWIPSDDAVRGRTNGLLRMENVTLDSYGYKEQASGPGTPGSAALTLTRGTVKLNSTQFSGAVHSIYSRILNGVLCRYVGLSDGTLYRDEANAGTYPDQLVADGGPASTVRDAFGAAFNYVLICAGQTRIKDDGTNLYTLGVDPPTEAVDVEPASALTVDISSSWEVTATDGTVTSSATDHFVADPVDTGNGVKFTGYYTELAPENLMDFGGSAVGTPDDVLGINFRCPDSDIFVRLKVTFYFNTVDGSPLSDPDFTDYYEVTWDNIQGLIGLIPPIPGPVIRSGINQWNVLQCKRSDFYRVGGNSADDWTNVLGVRYAVEFSAPCTGLCIAESWFSGSTAGPLNGNYEYLQVNVGNHGYYAKSVAGPPLTVPVSLLNSYCIITPQLPTDPQVNEVWLFRRNSGVPGSDPLANFLRIAQITSGLDSPFTDTVSDVDAQVIDVKLNQFLQGVTDTNFPNDVYFMETNYYERTWYMCPRSIMLSEPLNPDAIDLRFTINLSGDSSELNLWMIKAGPSTILVGTTLDIYELDGTAEELPDGTIDLTIRSLGIKQPPVEATVCLYKNTLFYIGTDGLNSLTGSVNTSFNGNLDLLWSGNTRFGQLPFYKSPANNQNFRIVASKGKLFIAATLSDTTRTTIVYDFKRNYWYVYLLSSYSLFVEEDDTLLAGFANGGDFYLRIIDVGNTFDYNGNGQTVRLLFPSLDNAQPLNRKDSFTLKLMIDTGGKNFTVNMYKDESSSPVVITTTLNTNGITEVKFDISSSVGICKRYQLELLCPGGTNEFRMTEWEIEYDARPTQTLYLRIPPNNFNIAGRKRIPAIPLLIDTLGNNVTFTPVLDNTAQATSTINTSDKEVYNHFFTADEKAYVFGGLLQGSNYFEFYESITPRIIELLPDPARFFYMPTDTLGTQCRKRIIAIAFIIDTQGNDVTYTPIVDGSAQTPATVNTTGKRTFIYYFTTNVEGIDIAGTLSGASFFEYYGLELSECLSEKMPVATKILRIPQDNYGTPNNKLFSSFKFQINTRGSDVTFTPRMDSSDLTPQVYNTTEKTTVEYFFDDVFGIDLGGLLTSATGPFEYYGPLKEQDIVVQPPRLTRLFTQTNNFGIPAPKRIRTIPFVINTNGSDVDVYPFIDGDQYNTQVFNTAAKQTVFYYFTTDAFGTDFAMELQSTDVTVPFEFFGMLTPVDVEVLPVGKKFDQLGPIEFAKIGKLLEFRIRLVTGTGDLNWNLYLDEVSTLTGALGAVDNTDQVCTIKLPKGMTCTVFRLELSATEDAFHRFYGRFKVNKSGMDTESQWMMFGADPDQKPK